MDRSDRIEPDEVILGRAAQHDFALWQKEADTGQAVFSSLSDPTTRARVDGRLARSRHAGVWILCRRVARWRLQSRDEATNHRDLVAERLAPSDLLQWHGLVHREQMRLCCGATLQGFWA